MLNSHLGEIKFLDMFNCQGLICPDQKYAMFSENNSS